MNSNKINLVNKFVPVYEFQYQLRLDIVPKYTIPRNQIVEKPDEL
jgi:hypothetical protein